MTMVDQIFEQSSSRRPRVPKPSEVGVLRAQAKALAEAEAAEPLTANAAMDAHYDSHADEPEIPDVPNHGRPLRNMSEVRHFFRTNKTPIYFVGATPVNLLGLDRWVRKFNYITYYDGWDGAHPRVFTPSEKPYVDFQSGEEINNWLLLNPEVREYIDNRRAEGGPRPKIAMVFFNEETEAICEELGYDLILPSAELRERLDSKIVTTQLGNAAGAASVPNVLGAAKNYKELCKLADEASLGSDLVVQTPYGDSGKTTFFIASESDWDKHAKYMVDEQLKVMKRINNRPVAVEAVLTHCGTVVGPILTELAGFKELTPYKGGWCGNEMYQNVVTDSQRERTIDLVRRVGDGLRKEGYQGFFEVDVLLDTDSDDVYLGELNPRISGASAITNVTAGAYADVPLFLFHLLEYLEVDFELDIDEINERWVELSEADHWSHMIIKETDDIVQFITHAPKTGKYVLDSKGRLAFARNSLDWHQLQNEKEAFFLRIYGVEDYRWKGADLGVLVTKTRLQYTSKKGETRLSIDAKHLVDSIRAQYKGIDVPGAEGA